MLRNQVKCNYSRGAKPASSGISKMSLAATEVCYILHTTNSLEQIFNRHHKTAESKLQRITLPFETASIIDEV